MVTAKDIQNILDSYDERVDDIINDEIKPRFINECTTQIKIKEEEVNSVHQMSRVHFLNQMRKRGFDIEHSNTQKPFSDPFYTVSLPPNEE